MSDGIVRSRRDVRRVDRRRRHAGPDRLLGRVVRAVQDDRAGARRHRQASTRAAIQIAKLNVDDNPNIARRFDVMSIPTLLVFTDGEVQEAPRRRQGQGAAARGALRVHRLEPAGPRASDAAAVRTRGDRGPRPPAAARRAAGVRDRLDGDVRRRDRSARCARSRTQRGLRVDGICGPETWGALIESWLPPRRPAALPAPADAARRRRRRPPAPAERARLRRGPRGRHPRPRDRGRAARSSSATPASRPTACAGRRPSPRSIGSARSPAARSPRCASARRCGAIAGGSTDRGCSSSPTRASPCSAPRSPARLRERRRGGRARHLGRRAERARRRGQPVRRRRLRRARHRRRARRPLRVLRQPRRSAPRAASASRRG